MNSSRKRTRTVSNNASQKLARRSSIYTKGVKGKQVEIKFKDTDSSNNPVAGSGSLFATSDITQGIAQQQRIGNSVHAIALDVDVDVNFLVSPGPSKLYYAVVLDTQVISDTLPATGDIFTSFGSQNIKLNLNNLGRYRVLYEKYILRDNEKLRTAWHFSVPLNFNMRFNGAAGNDFQKNAVYIVLESNTGTGTTTVASATRLKFTDQ